VYPQSNTGGGSQCRVGEPEDISCTWAVIGSYIRSDCTPKASQRAREVEVRGCHQGA
jgi:hypothetical protein